MAGRACPSRQLEPRIGFSSVILNRWIHRQVGLERHFSVYNVPTTCYIQPFKRQSLRWFVGCERKNLQTALEFRPPLDSNRSFGYRMRSEGIEIRRCFLARW